MARRYDTRLHLFFHWQLKWLTLTWQCFTLKWAWTQGSAKVNIFAFRRHALVSESRTGGVLLCFAKPKTQPELEIGEGSVHYGCSVSGTTNWIGTGLMAHGPGSGKTGTVISASPDAAGAGAGAAFRSRDRIYNGIHFNFGFKYYRYKMHKKSEPAPKRPEPRRKWLVWAWSEPEPKL